MAKVTQVQDAKGVPSAAPKRKLKFSEYAVDQLKPNIVVRRLADPTKQKTLTAGLLFTALRAWIVANDDSKFIADVLYTKLVTCLLSGIKQIWKNGQPSPAQLFGYGD